MRDVKRWRGLLSTADAHPVATVAVLAAVARLAVALTSFAVVGGRLFADERSFQQVAEAVASGRGAESWVEGYGQSFYHSTWGFSGLVAALYRVVTPSRIVGQLVAVGFGVLVAVVVVRLALAVVPRRWAFVAGAAVALLPSQVVWSSVMLRESAVWAGLAVLALAVTRLAGARGVRLLGWAVLGVGAFAYLGTLRTQTMVAAEVALLVVPLLPGPARLARAAGVVGVVVLVPIAFGLGPASVDFVRAAGSSLGATRTNLGANANSSFTEQQVAGGTADDDDLTRLPSYCRNASKGGALYIACRNAQHVRGRQVVVGPGGELYAVEEGVSANLSHLPTGLVSSLLRPFVWESAPNLSVLTAKLESLLWYGLYLLAIVGAVAQGWRRRDVLGFPMVVGLGLVGIGALAEGNLGTAFRHRAQLVWVLALLAAVGGHHMAERRAARRA